jgi:hypothetical protein
MVERVGAVASAAQPEGTVVLSAAVAVGFDVSGEGLLAARLGALPVVRMALAADSLGIKGEAWMVFGKDASCASCEWLVPVIRVPMDVNLHNQPTWSVYGHVRETYSRPRGL